jgi:hypothetical protein
MMKITRLQKGYRINVSDSEMALLHISVEEGMGSAMWEEGWQRSHIPPEQRRIMTEIQRGQRDWMVVTNDRRS